MDIEQLSLTDQVRPLRQQVPATERVRRVSQLDRQREAWDEEVFLRAYNGFATQLSRPAFNEGSDRLNELALLYQRSEATTLEGFAGHILTTHRV